MNAIIVGAPHSYTSVVAKFYIEQLGYKRTSEKESLLDYEVFEPDYSIKDGFRYKELAEDINSNDGYVYKLPLLPLIYDKLIPLLKNIDKIEFIYVIRNPADILASSNEKGRYDMNYYFMRMTLIYQCVLNSGVKHKIVMGEDYLPVNLRKRRELSWRPTRMLIKLWSWFNVKKV
jgi:hypothetical protein